MIVWWEFCPTSFKVASGARGYIVDRHMVSSDLNFRREGIVLEHFLLREQSRFMKYRSQKEDNFTAPFYVLEMNLTATNDLKWYLIFN